MQIAFPPNIPQPIVEVFKQLNRGKTDQNPQVPVNIMTCNSAITGSGGLPLAADYPFSLIFDKYRNQLAVSNGVVWSPITMGAHY